MLSKLPNNWFCYLVGIGVILLLVYYVCKWVKNKYPDPEDAIYYQVTDVNGNKGIIHDSGVKSSEHPPGSNFNLQILKTEINNEKEIELSTPEYFEHWASS